MRSKTLERRARLIGNVDEKKNAKKKKRAKKVFSSSESILLYQPSQKKGEKEWGNTLVRVCSRNGKGQVLILSLQGRKEAGQSIEKSKRASKEGNAVLCLPILESKNLGTCCVFVPCKETKNRPIVEESWNSYGDQASSISQKPT